ncbi:hypothetical protein BJF82_11235 [Kytococcus sp. CUA-901]|nr:hypothetical protein BJF82_11235 [Kytococcus sp. CUA-901]
MDRSTRPLLSVRSALRSAALARQVVAVETAVAVTEAVVGPAGDAVAARVGAADAVVLASTTRTSSSSRRVASVRWVSLAR